MGQNNRFDRYGTAREIWLLLNLDERNFGAILLREQEITKVPF